MASCLRQNTASAKKAPLPVICVGNLTAGGGGKTPTVIVLAKILKELGKKPFALSRGYGGSLRGPVQVNAKHTAAEVGDEPLLLAAHLPTVVARDRVAGAAFAHTQGADIILMDDGFQNPHIAKDFSLLVVDGDYGFGNGWLLPAGPLREPVRKGVARADAVLVINGKMNTDKPIFHGELVADMPALRSKKVVGFAGIARPEKFLLTLKQIGCEVPEFHKFPDHHPFTETDLAMLKKRAEKTSAILVTTEKDAVRLPAQMRQEVTVVPVVLKIRERAALMEALRKVCA